MNITVTVTVYGGKSPDGISVLIDNLDNTHDHNFNSSGSFSQNFDLEDGGKYLIRVSGFNPNSDAAHTEIKVSGKFKVGPLPNDTRDVKTPLIRETFYVEV